MKFRFKRQKNKSGMMNKNKRTKNLNGRMKFKVKIMKCSFSGKQLNQIWNSQPVLVQIEPSITEAFDPLTKFR